jgi:hypothetical protein
VGRDEQGNQTATVTHRGGGNVGSNEAYLRTLSIANANIEPMEREAKYHADRINARTNRINPVTGQADFAHPEEERKRSMLKLRQLNDSMEYQRAQAQQQAFQAQAEADAARDSSVQEYETVESINRRAGQIAHENAAKALAPLYTVSGK